MITAAILLAIIILSLTSIIGYLLYREHQRIIKQSFITKNIFRFAWWCGTHDMNIFKSNEPDIVFVGIQTPPPTPIEKDLPPEYRYSLAAHEFPNPCD